MQGGCTSEPREGPCELGESAGYKWVRIDDYWENATLTDCNTNPGADIDAVCIYRGEAEIGCAIDVHVNGDPVCWENAKDDELEVLDIPDAYTPWDSPGEPWTGYYSLNGRSIVLSFDADVEFLCGDEVGVFEVHNAEDPGATEEMYQTSIGAGSDCFGGTDCIWSLESDWAVGEDYIDVSWEW